MKILTKAKPKEKFAIVLQHWYFSTFTSVSSLCTAMWFRLKSLCFLCKWIWHSGRQLTLGMSQDL